MSRDAWLTMHILGVVLFLGNIAVTALWKVLADRTREPSVVAFSQRVVLVSDVVFTATGVVLILVSGQVMAEDFGGVFGPTWLTLGWSFFIASGAIWLAILIPIEVKQWRLARRFSSGGEIPDVFWRLSTLWAVAGGIATVLPFVNVYLMVFKPD